MNDKMRENVKAKIHLVSTTMPLDRIFREVRRKTNVIGCFEIIAILDKLLFLTFDFINQLIVNALFCNNP